VKFSFLQQHRKTWPVRLICSVLGISASGFYAWVNRAESKRARANRELLEDIRRIHNNSSGTYGSPLCMLRCAATDRTWAAAGLNC
jgi:hypothetical protein